MRMPFTRWIELEFSGLYWNTELDGNGGSMRRGGDIPRQSHRRRPILASSDPVAVVALPLRPDERPAAACLGCLNTAELDRAATFRQPEDANRFLTGRVLLRRCLASRLGVSPAALTLVEDRNGGTRLAGASRGRACHFSVTHSGELVAVAVGAVPVGLDIEAIGQEAPSLALIARCCTPEEAADLAGRSEPDRLHGFVRLWTRKEALIKGGAISSMVEAATVDVRHPVPRSRAVGRHWRLHDILLSGAEDYAAALAVRARLTVRVALEDGRQIYREAAP